MGFNWGAMLGAAAQSGMNTYRQLSEEERQKAADQRAQELHTEQMDALSNARLDREAKRQAGEALTAQGYDVGGTTQATSDDANQFVREARRGIPTGNGAEVQDAAQVAAPKAIPVTDHLAAAKRAADILNKRGMTTEADALLERGKQKAFEEAGKAIIDDFQAMPLQDFIEKHYGALSKDPNHPLVASVTVDPKTKQQQVVATNQQTGRSVVMSPEQALYHTLSLAQMGAGDVKGGLDAMMKAQDQAIKQQTADASTTTASAAMKKALTDEAEAPSKIQLNKSHAGYFDAYGNFIRNGGAAAQKEKLSDRVEEMADAYVKSGYVKTIEEGRTLAWRQSVKDPNLKPGVTRPDVDIKPNTDGSGWTAFAKNGGRVLWNVAPDGTEIPKGMTPSEFMTARQKAVKAGVQMGLGHNDAGELMVGYVGKDNNTYSTLEEAINPPKAKGKPGVSTEKPGPGKSQLSAAEQLDLQTAFRQKPRPAAPPFIGQRPAFGPDDLARLRDMTSTRVVNPTALPVEFTSDIYRSR